MVIQQTRKLLHNSPIILILVIFASAHVLTHPQLSQTNLTVLSIAVCLILGFAIGKVYGAGECVAYGRPRLTSADLKVEKYTANGTFQRTFKILQEEDSIYRVQHKIENRSYEVETSPLPWFETKAELSAIVSERKGDKYVTSWIEEIEHEAILFIQRDLE